MDGTIDEIGIMEMRAVPFREASQPFKMFYWMTEGKATNDKGKWQRIERRQNDAQS